MRGILLPSIMPLCCVINQNFLSLVSLYLRYVHHVHVFARLSNVQEAHTHSVLFEVLYYCSFFCGACQGAGLGFLQVIVGSFVSDGSKELKFAKYMRCCSAPPKVNLGGIIGSSTSPSHGTPSESSDGTASPLNLSSGGLQ